MMNYTLDDKGYIWMCLADRTSIKRRNKILSLEPSAELLFKNIANYRTAITEAYGAEYYNNLIKYHDLDLINSFIEENNKLDVKIITLSNKRYPDQLRNIPIPPSVLFCKGDLSLLDSRIIAVVGTRSITRYGIDVTEKFTKAFTEAGLTIVSGLARGVDATSHKTALSAGGKTIAVSPCGLDRIYPIENRDLFERIVDNGLIVTEYVLGTSVKQYTFTERNRIISGLAEAVFISEAGCPSGSLITANNAVEQGRELFVVPGNIYNKQSVGCNKLIKELQGAMVTYPEDVLGVLGFDTTPDVLKKDKQTQLTIEEATVINLLENEEQHFEVLVSKSGLSVSELNAILLKLEVAGIVKRLPGNYFGI